ncbi:unnamed protein product [Nezara viridula]|uniref:Uncharacterized protein n=1 Tax=Nezara viridula TaxID=85310 RepID=A0A9P0H9L4_NEZVI|nr:unnamed protein product [Nezara viridula]
MGLKTSASLEALDTRVDHVFRPSRIFRPFFHYLLPPYATSAPTNNRSTKHVALTTSRLRIHIQVQIDIHNR